MVHLNNDSISLFWMLFFNSKKIILWVKSAWFIKLRYPTMNTQNIRKICRLFHFCMLYWGSSHKAMRLLLYVYWFKHWTSLHCNWHVCYYKMILILQYTIEENFDIIILGNLPLSRYVMNSMWRCVFKY